MDRRDVVCLVVCWACAASGARARDRFPTGPRPAPDAEAEEGAPRPKDERERREDLIDRQKGILAKRPTQDWAFDKLFRLHVELNRVKELVEDYRALAKEAPEDRAPAIVLARLHQRTDEPAKAVEILSAI